MRTLSFLAAGLVLTALPAAPLAAQAPAVHLIAAPDAKSPSIFGNVPFVRALPDGGLLVNDVQKRQLSRLDASLGQATIIADSTSGGASSYGARPGGLIPYLADSSLFVDPAGLAMFVLDGNAKIARVASIPRSQDANFIGSNTSNLPAVDRRGRLVYRAGLALVRQGMGSAMPGSGLPVLPDLPDSASILRVDLKTRQLDTIALYKIPKVTMRVEQTERGISMSTETNPLPTVDDWALLSDGRLAIVRGQEYRVEFVDHDGARTVGPKLPFDWQRLDDDAKIAVVDSAQKAASAAREAAAKGDASFSTGGAMGEGRITIQSRTMIGGGTTTTTNGGGAGATFVSPSELPDYRPAFSLGAARADADGNLWIRTSSVREGTPGFIYDVVNGKGELIDRVQLPAGRHVVGFGTGGVVYLAARDASGSWIERTRRQ